MYRRRALLIIGAMSAPACTSANDVEVSDSIPEVSIDTPPVSRGPDDPSTPIPTKPVIGVSLTPLHAEPLCDDQGTCCPDGTIPVLGTPGNDVLLTAEANRCHVALGGSDVVKDKSPAGFHAALGGDGNDDLKGVLTTARIRSAAPTRPGGDR